jgi:predicted nucleic acid-binding protein
LRTLIIDASVATRFLLEEDYSSQAQEALEDFIEGNLDLSAPRLIMAEVGNALRTASAKGLVGEDEASDLYSKLLDLSLGRIETSDEDHKHILELGIRKKMSFYDAVYIYTSKVNGATLLTADDAQRRYAEGETDVLHLKDFTKRTGNTH